MEIDYEIVEKTRSCNKCYDCLSNTDLILCKVESFIGDELIFVKCKNNEFCSYKMAFGNSYICNCPTRIEIYKKYEL